MSNLLKIVLACAVFMLPAMGYAQGKVAVVNLEEAILQTDEAQKRLANLRDENDYKSDKSEFDRLKTEHEDLVTKLKNDMAVMSQDQQITARKKLASKQADIEHVLRKLQQAEQDMGQSLLREMSPKVQAVLRDLIQSEGIGLLLQRSSVIHADTSYSITAKVTDKLNQGATE